MGDKVTQATESAGFVRAKYLKRSAAARFSAYTQHATRLPASGLDNHLG